MGLISLIIRIASYNILHGEYVDFDFKKIADEITNNNVDICGFQEVDFITKRNNKTDTMERLACYTGYEYRFTKSLDFQGGEYGTGFISRFPVVSHSVHNLFSDGHESRSFSHSELETDSGILHFCNTHLSYESKELRSKQFEEIKELTKDMFPLFITGDFNTEDFSEFDILSGCKIINNSSDRKVTFPSSEIAIDNIIYSDKIKLVNSFTVIKNFSDHYMLIGDFEL